MISRPYAAFKHVVLKCSIKKGEEFPSQKTRRLGWRFIISGCVEITYPDGTTKRLYSGDFALDKDIISNRTIEFLEDTEWYCLSDIGNTDLVVPEFIRLEQNNKFEAAKDSDVFIATGIIDIDGTQYEAPYKLRIRTKDCVLTALTQSYLFKFK